MGFLKICAGFISENVMTFQDSTTSAPVTLQNLLERGLSIWLVKNGNTVTIPNCQQMVVCGQQCIEEGGQVCIEEGGQLSLI